MATVPPPPCSDFDGTGFVEVSDVMAVASRWRLTAANPNPDNDANTPNYEPAYDPNGDGRITVLDVMGVAAYWGQSCP